MEKELGLFTYGIMGFSLCYNKETEQIEKDLLIMYYGNGKKYVFKKESAYNLICAINGKQNPNGSCFIKDVFDFELKYMSNIINVLNNRLKGRAFVLITKSKNPVEYINAVQNEVIGITGLDLDGNLIAKSTNELFKDGFANFDVDNYCEPPKNFKKNTKIIFDA